MLNNSCSAAPNCRSVLELGQFEACPPVGRGRSWLRGRRVGRGRASSLPAELPLDVVSFGAASLESIVAELQGKEGLRRRKGSYSSY